MELLLIPKGLTHHWQPSAGNRFVCGTVPVFSQNSDLKNLRDHIKAIIYAIKAPQEGAGFHHLSRGGLRVAVRRLWEPRVRSPTPWPTPPPSGRAPRALRAGKARLRPPARGAGKFRLQRFLSSAASLPALRRCSFRACLPSARPPLSFSVRGWCGPAGDRWPRNRGVFLYPHGTHLYDKFYSLHILF